ncbi:MAG: PKD domain-containing protein, partial [Armatimonadetes bacterium]|nr:PKD domain-containing protein [Armatimonadota bacterium]
FSDQSDVFYLGRVALLVDRRPVELTVEATPSITRVDQMIDFSVELRGGPVNPVVSWDFDESDGIQQQAVGPKAKYIYKKPGDYIATCTVRDRGGVQPDSVKSVGIRVEGAK